VSITVFSLEQGGSARVASIQAFFIIFQARAKHVYRQLRDAVQSRN
jgi:hypothetical protein